MLFIVAVFVVVFSPSWIWPTRYAPWVRFWYLFDAQNLPFKVLFSADRSSAAYPSSQQQCNCHPSSRFAEWTLSIDTWAAGK